MVKRKNSDDYWKKREADERKWIDSNIKNDADFDKIIQKHYDKLVQNINKDISEQYVKYAGREGISLAEAQKAVSRHDVQAFSSEAKETVARAREIFKKKGSVAYSDFESSLNQRLRLYNATMRINRLEYLKANLGLELINTNIDVGSELAERLKEGYSGEARRQAGILGEAMGNTNIKNASKIVMAQTKNANFSDRLWSNSDVLKTKLDSILTQQYVQGINPRVIATKLRPLLADNVKNARYVTERLARTESARVAATAQLESFKKYGYKYVKWIAEPSACKICVSIASTNDGIYSLKDVPYLPAHANCRCSISAWSGDVGNLKDTTNETSGGNKTTSEVPNLLNDKIVQAVGKEHAKNINAILNKAPKDIQNVWKKYAKNVDVEIRQKVKSSGGGNAFYNRNENKIVLQPEHLTQAKQKEKNYSTFFHEMGHAIDFNAEKDGSGFFSANSDFYEDVVESGSNLLKNITKKFVSNVKDSDISYVNGKPRYQFVFDVKVGKNGKITSASAQPLAIRDFLSSVKEKYGHYTEAWSINPHARDELLDIGDILSGATKGKYNDWLPGSHTSTYWKKSGNDGRVTEAFAELTQAYIANPTTLNIIKGEMPDLYKAYLKTIKKML